MSRKTHYDFLPAVLEVQETPPSPVGRIILWVIIFLIAIAVVWASCSRVDVVAIADGKLAASDLSRPVSSAVTAEVEAVWVREGMLVKKGQPLIQLNAQTLLSRREDLRLLNKYNRFQVARLTLLNAHLLGEKAASQLSDACFSEDADLAGQITTRLRAEIENDRKEKQVLRDNIAVLEAQKKWYAGQQAQYQQLLPLYEEQMKALRTLHQKQFTSRDSVLEIQKKHIEARYALTSATAKLDETEVTIRKAETEYEARIAEKRQQFTTELSEKEHENQRVNYQLAELDAQIAQYTLRAPVEGVVDALVFRDAGAAVEAPQELLRIVPVSEPLNAEIFINNQDVGFINVGQPVTVKVNTFDFTRFGWIEGTLTALSADASEDKDRGLLYRATVKLDKQTLLIDGGEKKLEPGMQVSVEVVTGERTLLSYLLSPALEAMNSVGKQR